MMPFNSIHVAVNGKILFFSYGCCILLCVCVYSTAFFIRPSVDGHLSCFHVLAIVNNAAVNIGVACIFSNYCFCFIRYIPRSRIAGSYDSSVFRFLRNFHTIFHNGCTSLHSHQIVRAFPFLHVLTSVCCL